MATTPSGFMFFALLLTSSFFVSLAASLNISKPFPAYFIFGDSLVDVGNNNYITTAAKANTLPFGIDFPQGPTGRFCNGKTVVDFVSELISLPFSPPYLAPTTTGQALLQGVSYASAAGGILQSAGYDFVGRVDFDTQIQWFSNTIQELQQLIGVSATKTLIAQSLYSTTFGSNDYVNNYVFPSSPVAKYSAPQYQQILLDKFSLQLTQLYNLGVRNLAIANIGPIGCIPEQTSRKSVQGECVENMNSLASNYNEGLKGLIDELNSKLPGAQFVYVDTFDPVVAFRNDPAKYGFKDGVTACCGAGRFKGRLPCLAFLKACQDRQDHVWWDAFHTSEATNKLLANGLYQTLKGRVQGGKGRR